MDEIRCDEFYYEGREHISEEDNGFGNVGTDEIKGRTEDDDIEDIVN
jgi:hypothetical protein